MFKGIDIVAIFSVVDEFFIEFNHCLDKNSIGNRPKRKPKMNGSEVLTIMILSQLDIPDQADPLKQQEK